MKKLIIGLGNPGKKYEKNRHNLGFRVADALARELGLAFKHNKKFVAEIATPHLSSPTSGEELKEGVILAKPQTFMNDSGRAVSVLKNFYKLGNRDLLIVHDEIDLPLGKMRLSQDAGSAGHHGVESIIATIGQDFARLRIGIDGRESRKHIATEDYVLQNFTAEEEKKLKEIIIPKAADEIKSQIK